LGHQGTKAQRNTKEFYFKDKNNIIFVPLSVFVPWWLRKSKKEVVDLGVIFPLNTSLLFVKILETQRTTK
jgi:hypothetical protein